MHVDTVLEEGDEVLVVLDPDIEAELTKYLGLEEDAAESLAGQVFRPRSTSVEGAPTAGKLQVHVQACDGSSLPHMEVTVVSAKLGYRQTSRTNLDGDVFFDALRNHPYELTTQSLQGMKSPLYSFCPSWIGIK